MGDPTELSRDLHRIFPEESAQSFYKALTKDASFAYLRRRALPEQVAQVNALGEIAIEFPREKERLYPQRTLGAHVLGFVDRDGHGAMRSEEHTPELQSLMRISYAVFCLKNKNLC